MEGGEGEGERTEASGVMPVGGPGKQLIILEKGRTGGERDIVKMEPESRTV